MKDKHVSELFKEHCERCIKDDKGKNYNYLQETYAKTELFDLSLLKYNEGYNMGKVKIQREKDEWVIHADYLKNITLPFEAIFVKLPIVDDLPSSIFIHEFNPTTITGTYILTIPNRCQVTNVFHILVDKGVLDVPINKDLLVYSDNNQELKELVGGIVNAVTWGLIFTIRNLNNLPKQTVVADKVNKAEYYRRRGLPTLKVYKPIYYVMDKKEGENKGSRSYKLIKPLGKLEYTYSFRVRSHWRRIDPKSYGKNRNGEYVVKGYTFVRDYIKGEGELVKRVRVLK